jgi:glycosyltransferase involved in cell wall biosynthesis
MDRSASPRVTVVIPTYNRAHLLGRSIRSVLGQTYQDFELIVVDDCSTDNTEDVVMSLSDERTRYVRLGANSGTPAAPTNVGISCAAGGYIAIQDSDDEWLPRKLERQVEVLASAPPAVGVVYTDMWRVGEGGTRERWRSPRVMPRDGTVYRAALGYQLAGIGTITLLARRECFDDVGLFDETIPMFIDTEWLIRVSREYCLYHIDEPLANWFPTAGSVTSDVTAAIAARRHILRKYFTDIRRDRKLLARHYLDIGLAMADAGRMREGRAYLMQAAATRPPSLKAVLHAALSLLGRPGYRGTMAGYARVRKLLTR